MQSIERYGVVALLFLIVTVAAVLLWGSDELPEEGGGPGNVATATSGPDPGSALVSSRADAQREPLTDANARRRAAQARAQREAELEASRTASRGTSRFGVPSGGPSERGGIVPGGTEDERGVEPSVDLALQEQQAEAAAAATRRAERDRLERERAAERRREREQLELARLEAEEQERRDARRRKESESALGNGLLVYVVAKNEVLSKIAQRELGTVKRMGEIIDLNPGLNPDRITEGLKLVMPKDWDSTGKRVARLSEPVERKAPQPAAPAGTRKYTVREGESLWQIAAAQLGSGPRYRELETLNPQLESGVLRPGDVLFLPNSEVALAAPRSNTPAPRERAERSSGTRGRVR